MSPSAVSAGLRPKPRLFHIKGNGRVTPVSPSRRDASGEVIASDGGPYQLLGRLGSGGMASVFLACRSDESPQLFAIKRLHPDFAGEREFERMFLDEARVAAYLDHPNLVAVHEVGEDGGVPYIVFDYVAGDTLDALAPEAVAADEGRSAPASVVVAIVLDLLDALDHAHHARGPDGAPLGLVHRDVAPSNVLVGTDGRARLIDFGIARAHARLAETLSGQRKGRLDYMAPEQLMDVEDLDLRADVFSVGTLLWTALVGRSLFRGDHDPQTMERLLHMPIPAVSRFRPELPGSLDAIVSKSLQRDRTDRFRDAGAMARALRRSALASDLWAPRRTVGAFVRGAAAETLARRAELLQRHGVTVSDTRPTSAPGLSSHVGSITPEEGRSPRASPPPPARRFARQVGELFAQGPVFPKSAK